MFTTYFRSSSLGTWEWCKHKKYLSYVLGFKEPGNKKAEMGNVFHKVMEILAHRKLAEQNNNEWVEDENLGRFHVSDCVPRLLLDKSFDYHRGRTPEFERGGPNAGKNPWIEKDRETCWMWVEKAMNEWNGDFNPMNCDIVSPEQHFNMEIPYDWAKYDYVLNGQTVTGNLAIRGTIDLIQKIDDNTLEIIDYKTGERKDWNKGKTKEFADLMFDTQLRLYHYAAKLIYPQYKNIVVTILYVRSGGPFSLPFDDSYLPETEKFLKQTFNEMRSTLIPQKNVDWRCSKLCWFGRNNFEGTNTSICDHIHNQVLRKGIQSVTEEYVDLEKHNIYDGGGRIGKLSSEINNTKGG